MFINRMSINSFKMFTTIEYFIIIDDLNLLMEIRGLLIETPTKDWKNWFG